MTRDELREKVATICGGNYVAADAAIDIVLEEAARLVHTPSKPPCECVGWLKDGSWICDCDCTNGDDYARAVSWCDGANKAAAIRAMKGESNDAR